MNQRKKWSKVVRDESGSLIILVFALFLLLLIFSFEIINVSDTFLAKRELVELGEVAITRAAHSLSLSRYYSGNFLMDSGGVDGTQFRIPLDCQAAYLAFQEEVSGERLRGQSVSISGWSCSNDEVVATLEVVIPLLLKLPSSFGSSTSTISSTVGAISIVGGVRG